MKKSKLFGLFGATSALIASSATLAITSSCSCSTTYIEAADTDVSIIGNNMVAYLQYILKTDLKDNEEIKVELADDGGQFTFGAVTVKNKLVTLPVYWLKTNVYETIVWSNNITFKCVAKDSGKEIWSQVISGSKVTYNPYCILKTGVEFIATDLTISTKTVTAKVEFEIPTGLPDEETYHPRLKAHFNTGDYDNEFTIDEKNVTFEKEDDTHFIVSIPAIKSDTAVADGDFFKFDIQVYCMYGDTDIPIWISNNYIGLKASYAVAENPIPEEYLEYLPDPEFSAYGDYRELTGIKPEAFGKGYNSLVIPANYTRVGDKNAATHEAINLPDTVTKIVFAPNSSLTYFEENSFAGCSSIKFIDVSNIGDDAKGLETMQFGANSFNGWSESGTIVWGSDFSQYKRHMLILDLYAGGLTSIGWYNIVQVDDESTLREACATGSNIQLSDDITIAAQADYTGQIEIEKSLLIDLNGKTITSAAPIYNHKEKDFAIFGIWNGAEVVVTDFSPSHNGKVIAYDQRLNHAWCTGLAKEVYPTDPLSIYNHDYWDYYVDEITGIGTWKPRECRCFYIRTDTPTKARTSLEIMTGQYYGNCTTVMNWNGTCWIEDMFREAETTAYDFAPQFHIFTPFSTYKNEAVTDPYKEIINCDDGNSATGHANFEVYSAKFYSIHGLTADKQIGSWSCYDPANATGDLDKKGNPHDWLALNYTSKYCNATGQEITESQVTDGCYRLTYPKP